MTKRQIFNGWQKITNTQKTETLKQLKIRTDMNSDAPYESVVRTSLIPLQERKSWGQLPSLLLKIEGGGGNSFAPLFGIKFKKNKLFFYYSMEAYIVHLAKGMLWNHSDFFFFIAPVLKICTRQIRNTFFVQIS